MVRNRLIMTVVVALLTIAVPGWSSFQVADLVYVPVVSAGTGANDSVWRSDVVIYNADDTDIDVAIVFLPSGLFSNSGRFSDRQTWLGGRDSDGFGIVEESLADIPPGGTVSIENIVGTYWPDDAGVNGNGALVVFAYEADTLEDDGTRVYRNAIVNSRTYNQTSIFEPDPENEGEFLETDATYGQTIPGVPWYNLAYAEEFTEDADLSSQLLLGGVENAEFRYNVGILNTSDPQTQLTIRLQPYQRDGTPFVDADDNPIFSIISVPPLAHLQYFRVMSNLFGLDSGAEDLTDVTIRVSWIGWQTTSVEPVPAITTYGSIVDEVSNDPTTVLPSFGEPYPVDCVWFTDPETKTGAVVAGSRAARPVEIPSR